MDTTEETKPEPGTTARAGLLGDGASILDTMREGLQILGFDWRYLYVNQAAATHGRRTKQELLGRTILELYPDIVHTPGFSLLARCMSERTAQCFENEFTYPDGNKTWFELRIEPVPEGILVLSIDIGRRRELEQTLAHVQKMDAIGRLASGIAHDFNNLLTVILHSSEFLSRALAHDQPLQMDVSEIKLAAERGAELVRQLLTLGRKQPHAPVVLEIHDYLSASLPMLKRLATELIDINMGVPVQPLCVTADPGQLSQVLINLVANARDAIEGSGQITLSASLLGAQEAQAQLSPGAPRPEQDYVRISICDTGRGMPPDTLARAFDPFFTTKAPGKGSGLGLAMCHALIAQNGGEIRARSNPGRGTCFDLYFPRSLELPESRVQEREAGCAAGGDEVVLVVDDEPAVRSLCARSLAQRGYTVMQAESPSDALRFVARYSGHIDLVLCDVVMPEMSGVALCAQLAQRRPGLQTLFMTGYAEHDQLASIEPGQLLLKPFTHEELAQRVRQFLDAAQGVIA